MRGGRDDDTCVCVSLVPRTLSRKGSMANVRGVRAEQKDKDDGPPWRSESRIKSHRQHVEVTWKDVVLFLPLRIQSPARSMTTFLVVVVKVGIGAYQRNTSRHPGVPVGGTFSTGPHDPPKPCFNPTTSRALTTKGVKGFYRGSNPGNELSQLHCGGKKPGTLPGWLAQGGERATTKIRLVGCVRRSLM